MGLERLGLAVGAVEGEHQLAPQALAVGVLPHEGAQLADQLGRAAGGQVGLHAALQRRQALLLQAGGRRLGERLEGQVGEGRSPPERESAAQRIRRRRRVAARGGLLRLLDQRLEALQVELPGR